MTTESEHATLLRGIALGIEAAAKYCADENMPMLAEVIRTFSAADIAAKNPTEQASDYQREHQGNRVDVVPDMGVVVRSETTNEAAAMTTNTVATVANRESVAQDDGSKPVRLGAEEAERRVKAKHPNADWVVYRVKDKAEFRIDADRFTVLGSGPTKDAAWLDAAWRL